MENKMIFDIGSDTTKFDSWKLVTYSDLLLQYVKFIIQNTSNFIIHLSFSVQDRLCHEGVP